MQKYTSYTVLTDSQCWRKKEEEENAEILTDTQYINKTRIEWYNTTWLVRYADDFMVGVKYESRGKDLKDPISEFLKVRGVELSEEKTQITPWKMAHKLDFLGWTHHIIFPNKAKWVINTTKHRPGKLLDWLGSYTYPSHASTANF